jgi:hypothetical protein
MTDIFDDFDKGYEPRPGTGFAVVRCYIPDIKRRNPDGGLDVGVEELGFFLDYARARAAVLADQAKRATPGAPMKWTRPDYTLVSPPHTWVIRPMTPNEWLARPHRAPTA